VLDVFDAYLQDWDAATGAGDSFRWSAAADADQVEYLLHAFHGLDARVDIEGQRGRRTPAPEGRLFYIALIQRLLDALTREGAARALFAEHLRSTWPGAAGFLLRDRVM
jgi:hypothetical protein